MHTEDIPRHTLGIDQTAKPLPRLPRGWSRACHETGLFLRSIGLGIVVTGFQGFFTQNFLEPEKAAVRQNRVTALLRRSEELLPLGIALFEIVLNWKGHYVGANFDKQNYLQFVAKTHEIFIQASITTIILSYSRYQISTSKGMPFGAMLGALQFLQVSYLWSVEFWSAIISKRFQTKEKLCFVGMIVICVMIAATAGPSSANLLIARQVTGVQTCALPIFSIDATFQDIWPDRVDDETVSNNCRITKLTSGEGVRHCPLDILYPFFETGPVPQLLGDAYSTASIQTLETQLPGTSNTIAMLLGGCWGDVNTQACSTHPQQVFVPGLNTDAKVRNAQQNKDVALDAYHTIKDKYFQPYSLVSCVTDTVQNRFDQAPLRFAIPLETDDKKTRDIVPMLAFPKSQSIDKIPGDSSQFRVGWVDLPHQIFNTKVPGAIVVHPQNSNDSSYNITTCTLNAGWGSSAVVTDYVNRNNIESYMSGIPASFTGRTIAVDAYGYAGYTGPNFLNRSNHAYPQKRTTISKNWMDSINPTFILFDNTTINPISMMLLQLPYTPSELQIATAFSLLLSAGLSSIGMEHNTTVFEKRAKASASCQTCLLYEIENSVYGWTYTAREITTKLGIVVMITYCVLVFAHVIYSAITGVSSTAWDSIAELVALAMNSSPTEALQNTCAGIVGKKAYQTPVRVLKTSEKHLELVFGEIKDPNANFSKLVMNEKYGGIEVGEENEDETMNVEGQGEIRKRALGQAGTYV